LRELSRIITRTRLATYIIPRLKVILRYMNTIFPSCRILANYTLLPATGERTISAHVTNLDSFLLLFYTSTCAHFHQLYVYALVFLVNAICSFFNSHFTSQFTFQQVMHICLYLLVADAGQNRLSAAFVHGPMHACTLFIRRFSPLLLFHADRSSFLYLTR
jgi:hypothetical protein